MPTHLRLRCSWQFYDDDPKNQAVINPCFRHSLEPVATLDAKALTDDLSTALAAWVVSSGGGNRQLTVAAYKIVNYPQAPGSPPNYPLAVTTRNAGALGSLNCPPELATCLSFYGDANVPRKRGRLYIPMFLLGVQGAELANTFIGSALQGKVLGLPSIFSGLGGANVDWIVWSSVGQHATKVTDYWTDDAWDIQRSRGVRATARAKGTTSG